MKNLYAIAAGGLICSALPAFAGGNHGGGGGVNVSTGHHASSEAAPSAPATVAPRLGNALPHYSKPFSYTPSITYRNGSRTLNYPAVGASNVQRGAHSNFTS